MDKSVFWKTWPAFVAGAMLGAGCALVAIYVAVLEPRREVFEDSYFTDINLRLELAAAYREKRLEKMVPRIEGGLPLLGVLIHDRFGDQKNALYWIARIQEHSRDYDLPLEGKGKELFEIETGGTSGMDAFHSRTGRY